MARTREVKNLQATLKQLAKFNPELLKELKKDLTQQAKPIFADVARRMPQQATPNWGATGRTGYSRDRAMRGLKVSVRSSRRVRGTKGSMAVINLTNTNAGGAIWDQAGSRGNYSPPVQRGQQFVRHLDRSTGRGAQRGLWPASVSRLDEIRDEFTSSIRKTEREINMTLARR
jgi:hypothetical protein